MQIMLRINLLSCLRRVINTLTQGEITFYGGTYHDNKNEPERNFPQGPCSRHCRNHRGSAHLSQDAHLQLRYWRHHRHQGRQHHLPGRFRHPHRTCGGGLQRQRSQRFAPAPGITYPSRCSVRFVFYRQNEVSHCHSSINKKSRMVFINSNSCRTYTVGVTIFVPHFGD